MLRESAIGERTHRHVVTTGAAKDAELSGYDATGMYRVSDAPLDRSALTSEQRARLDRELGPGETIVWAASTHPLRFRARRRLAVVPGAIALSVSLGSLALALPDALGARVHGDSTSIVAIAAVAAISAIAWYVIALHCANRPITQLQALTDQRIIELSANQLVSHWQPSVIGTSRRAHAAGYEDLSVTFTSGSHPDRITRTFFGLADARSAEKQLVSLPEKRVRLASEPFRESDREALSSTSPSDAGDFEPARDKSMR